MTPKEGQIKGGRGAGKARIFQSRCGRRAAPRTKERVGSKATPSLSRVNKNTAQPALRKAGDSSEGRPKGPAAQFLRVDQKGREADWALCRPGALQPVILVTPKPNSD